MSLKDLMNYCGGDLIEKMLYMLTKDQLREMAESLQENQLSKRGKTLSDLDSMSIEDLISLLTNVEKVDRSHYMKTLNVLSHDELTNMFKSLLNEELNLVLLSFIKISTIMIKLMEQKLEKSRTNQRALK
jgi:hypothetical protein